MGNTIRGRTRWLGTLLLISAIGWVGTSGAQSGGDFDIVKSSQTSGGGVAEGGDFSVTGAIGQADSSVASGGAFTVDGGLFAPLPAVDQPEVIFSNGFE